MKKETLNFYTNGESFTNLLRDFIKEGQINKVYSALKDGGLNKENIKNFFLYKSKFEGDTRENGILEFVNELEDYSSKLSDIYTTSICSIIKNPNKDYFEIYQWKSILKKSGYHKDFEKLVKIFSFDYLSKLCGTKILKRGGYVAKDKNSLEYEGNGVVLQDGSYITCDYMGHTNLYPILYELGLSSSSDWTNDDKLFHVSSGSLSGSLAWVLKDKGLYECIPTDAQLDSLFIFRRHIEKEYGGFNDKYTTELLRRYINSSEDYGGKYGNLIFLQRFYPNINLPKFSKTKLENKYCIRTSPKLSMPGLLNSKFEITNDSEKEIEKDFQNIMSLGHFKNNELHYFYQEYLEGQNGVSHYWKKGDFKYQLSNNRGDVVKGIKSNEILESNLYNELRSISRELFKDLNKPIQLEFVISNNKLYIVQLRILENNPSNFGVSYSPNGATLVNGKTFSTGCEYINTREITVDDILIVESDADSKELLNKKALIVESDIQFSHILALSKSLSIPSIYATGKIDKSKLTGSLNFCAKNEHGWITKNK